jgi:hypothetical protein
MDNVNCQEVNFKVIALVLVSIRVPEQEMIGDVVPGPSPTAHLRSLSGMKRNAQMRSS